MQCGSDEKYFAPAGNFRRRFDRLFREFCSMLHTEEHIKTETEAAEKSGAELKEMYPENVENIILKKRCQEALNVSGAWIKANAAHTPEFEEVYRGSLVYLGTAPVCPLPFPVWMLQRHISTEVEAVGKL